MQPSRGRWTNLAWASMVLIWIPAVVVGAVRQGLEPSAPTWLEWVANVLWAIALIVVGTYLCLRGREVITYRRSPRAGN